jgi:hypothetical protein
MDSSSSSGIDGPRDDAVTEALSSANVVKAELGRSSLKMLEEFCI